MIASERAIDAVPEHSGSLFILPFNPEFVDGVEKIFDIVKVNDVDNSPEASMFRGMSYVKDLTDALGRDESIKLVEACGRSRNAYGTMRMWRHMGTFPPHSAPMVAAAARRVGMPSPPIEVFTWNLPDERVVLCATGEPVE